MKKYVAVLLAAVLTFAVAGCSSTTSTTDTTDTNTTSELLQTQMPEVGEEVAVLSTSKGEVIVRFYPEEAPLAVENFKELAKSGYYDGLTFHRVIEDFMVQTGDPTGTGTGGESIWGEDFADEISPNLHYYKGALAMANRGAGTNGSQFFIVQAGTVSADIMKAIRDAMAENADLGLTIGEDFHLLSEIFPEEVLQHYEEVGGAAHLEYIFGNPYTIFGQVISGLEIVDDIAAVEVDESDKPVEDVIIESVKIVAYEG